MPSVERRVIRFVAALCRSQSGAGLVSKAYRLEGAQPASLDVTEVDRLASAGILTVADGRCRASVTARGWLRRQLAECDPYASQHRHLVGCDDGTSRNLADSPLARLAVPGAGETEPFLLPHQVEAGERFRRLSERARLRPRTTMSYDPTHTAGGRSGADDITDMAADARKRLASLIRHLPTDCANVVVDVLALEKGLQVIEAERHWPRRSAKLVLRIGLDQLAGQFGLAASTIGADGRTRHWLDDGARPSVFE